MKKGEEEEVKGDKPPLDLVAGFALFQGKGIKETISTISFPYLEQTT